MLIFSGRLVLLLVLYLWSTQGALAQYLVSINSDIDLWYDPRTFEGDYIAASESFDRRDLGSNSSLEERKLEAKKRAQAALINLLIDYRPSVYRKKVLEAVEEEKREFLESNHFDFRLDGEELADDFAEIMDDNLELGIRGITPYFTTVGAPWSSERDRITVTYVLRKRR